MKNKAYRLSVYIVVFLVCAWQAGEKANENINSEYGRQMQKLSYQIDYADTYSPVFSPYCNNTVQDANTTDTQEEKMVYLTFDDGPSPRTGEILDILKKHNIQATFFVIKTIKRLHRLRGRELPRRHHPTILMIVGAICFLLYAFTVVRIPSLAIFRKIAFAGLFCNLYCLLMLRFTRRISTHLTAMGALSALLVLSALLRLSTVLPALSRRAT